MWSLVLDMYCDVVFMLYVADKTYDNTNSVLCAVVCAIGCGELVVWPMAGGPHATITTAGVAL